MPAGRPTKLTDDIQEAICKHVAAGVSYADAARLAGVTRRTLLRWRRRGKSARSGKYCHFCHRIEASLATFRADAVEVITRAGQGHSPLRPYTKRKTEITAVVDAKGKDTGKRHTKVVEEEVGADWRPSVENKCSFGSFGCHKRGGFVRVSPFHRADRCGRVEVRVAAWATCTRRHGEGTGAHGRAAPRCRRVPARRVRRRVPARPSPLMEPRVHRGGREMGLTAGRPDPVRCV